MCFLLFQSAYQDFCSCFGSVIREPSHNREAVGSNAGRVIPKDVDRFGIAASLFAVQQLKGIE